MTEFLFARLWALCLLILLPLGWFWYLRIYDKKRVQFRLSYSPNLFYKPSSFFLKLRWLPEILQSLAFLIVVLALARPQLIEVQSDYRKGGANVVLAIDFSGSMSANDILPSRLEAAKQFVSQLLDSSQNEKYAIVVFGEQAFTLSPLTTDYSLLKEQLKDLNPNSIPKEGSSLGDALLVAINRLEVADNPAKQILILSDGACNQGVVAPLGALQEAIRSKIKLS
ncbi:MAG: VWA domain-containing protein, partial [Bacteroidia bacterium]|nr:VWA domain-containing protein [Bacteroidia bacterium]